jgi:H+/Cl- antiporter ClcA
MTGTSETASMLTSVSGAGAPPPTDEPTVDPARPVHPYVHVVVVALIAALAVLAWLAVYDAVSKLLWQNDLVMSNTWLALPISLAFSLVVGLLVKYRAAPTSMDESLLDSLSGDTSRIDWRQLPVNVLTSWASWPIPPSTVPRGWSAWRS